MPGFNINGQGAATNPQPWVETARAHRWEVIIDHAQWGNEVAAYAYSVGRPSLEFDKIIMHHRQNEIVLPGKYRWGSIDLKIYERFDNGGQDMGASILREWWSKVVANAAAHSLNLPADLKKNVRIRLLDGHGSAVWTYALSGAFPLKVTGSELDYSNTELATVAVTLVFDAVKEGKDI